MAKLCAIPTIADLLTLYQEESVPADEGYHREEEAQIYQRITDAFGCIPLPEITPVLLHSLCEQLVYPWESPEMVTGYLEALRQPFARAVEFYHWLATTPFAQIPRLPTVADLLTRYRQEYLPRKEGSTQYQTRLLYTKWSAEFGTLPLIRVTPEYLGRWRDTLLAQHLASGTVGRYMDVLRAPFTIAVKDYRWLKENPFERVPKPPPSPERVRILTEVEQQRLLLMCQIHRNPHLYLVVLVGLSTGLRKGEILERCWRDIDFDARVIRLPKTKTKRPRAVPCLGQALEALQRRYQEVHPQAGDWVFPRLDRRRPILIEAAWRKACQLAGVLDFHFHDLRHTTASYLAMSGASQFEIQEILGHKSLIQTRRYVHFVPTHTNGIMQKMLEQFSLA